MDELMTEGMTDEDPMHTYKIEVEKTGDAGLYKAVLRDRYSRIADGLGFGVEAAMFNLAESAAALADEAEWEEANGKYREVNCYIY